ncbi:phosphatase PAP2 family protein [Evansella cellulosilytica]|uniref:Phosphoesterase PA-phosphatase related protein n=1 Tax=Evansella cellulosilytica (strain ATCC 21833 / DSM 2522 / FERM P-1141 / JCM 9156 / N-4) TaxID=649639 RepID=E6U1R8_EVAC2|nr:phosphatase PAP2 family protein [Evansella cellulosilytica]ADU31565.1 phosphoesterase PA-phosphatase related protein [Evansella cellulosilytica DSM 2522]
MEKARYWFYEQDCSIFRLINRAEQESFYHRIMGMITHLGGARFTILFCVITLIFFQNELKAIAIISSLSLACSHALAIMIKKIVPRLRPYLAINYSYVAKNPLKDSSFPSGHTTAIFSLLLPYMFFANILIPILLPIAILVAISRITIGLHYPSDVIAGAFLGFITVISIMYVYPF